MTTPSSPLTEPAPPVSAVERALAFGADISLLIKNLRLTPTERVERAQQMLDSVVALQAEVKACRERQARAA